MPTLPKPPGQRRRRNRTAPIVYLPARTTQIPDPPGPLSPERLEWWQSVWASPVSAAWLEVDVHPVYRLGRLLDHPAPSAALLAEARLIEDRFGLSPASRRRLAVEVSLLSVVEDDAVEVDDPDRFARALPGG